MRDELAGDVGAVDFRLRFRETLDGALDPLQIDAFQLPFVQIVERRIVLFGEFFNRSFDEDVVAHLDLDHRDFRIDVLHLAQAEPGAPRAPAAIVSIPERTSR